MTDQMPLDTSYRRRARRRRTESFAYPPERWCSR